MSDKQSLRAQYRVLRADPARFADRAQRSASLIAQLRDLIARHGSWRRLGVYMALPDEPELMPLFCELSAAGYEICLPRVSGVEMDFYHWRAGEPLEEAGAFGIREPRLGAQRVAPESLDLIVVPAIAFDARRYRLGRGRGYYDRYLPQTRAVTVGVSLGLLPLERLEEDVWDRPMDLVLSP